MENIFENNGQKKYWQAVSVLQWCVRTDNNKIENVKSNSFWEVLEKSTYRINAWNENVQYSCHIPMVDYIWNL